MYNVCFDIFDFKPVKKSKNVQDFIVSKAGMCTVSIMNIKGASSTGTSRKRKWSKAFNANRLYNELYGYDDCLSEDDSVDDVYHSDTEYEYYDARGEPIIETRIRPGPIQRQVDSKIEEEEPVKVYDLDMMTNMATGESCPVQFLDSTVNWKEAMEAYRASIKKAEDDRIEAERAAERAIQEEQAEKARLAAIVASLPRFSTAMLKRMEEEKKKLETQEVRADPKFYTHNGGPSKTSNQAWGHRRNGGGKGKKTVTMIAKVGQIKLSSIRDEKYKKRMLEADQEAKLQRKLNREIRKEKEEEEKLERQKAIDRVTLFRLEKQPVKSVVVEETELQKLERERMEEIRRIVSSKVSEKEIEPKKKYDTIADVNDAIEADFVREREKEMKKEEVVETWITPKPKVVKDSKTSSEKLTEMFYAKPVELCKSIEKGIPCRFGSRCKFSHDTVTALKKETSTTRTRLCVSVVNGGRCRHGKNCLFAHTCDEFTPVMCNFGGRCRNVERVDGKWENVKGKQVCGFFHQGEDKDKRTMCVRIGMTREALEQSDRSSVKAREKSKPVRCEEIVAEKGNGSWSVKLQF